MRRRITVNFVSLLALVSTTAASGPATSVQYGQDQQNRYQPPSQEPLCRRPAALPLMAPEMQVRDRQQRYPMPPTVRPAVPPPPPTAVEPASRRPAPEEGSDIMVTGRSAAAPPAPAAPPPSVRTQTAPATTAPPPPPPPTGRMGRAPSPVVTPPPPPYPPRYNRQQQQAGILTAGDYDDLLNPELYARYVGNFLQGQQAYGMPAVDTGQVLTIAVNDGSGRPVPFASVTLTCRDGNRITLATLADGTVNFYPWLDRLGDAVRLTVASREGGTSDMRTLSITDAPGAQRHNVTLGGSGAPVGKFDLLLAIDTTGSMGDELSYLTTELRSILDDLRRTHRGLDIRLSLVVYRDMGDEYVTRTIPFTRDLDTFQRQLAAQYAGGGGDYPEAMDQALIRAVGQEWRPDAVKSLLLVADAPPHDRNIGLTWAAAEHARAKRIQIVPVAASGVADIAEYVMRGMAALTQSRYIFLTDDSGVGNPHAPPAVDCYLVTRLDRLVRRVLDSQISGRRVEPREGEVIRAVGQYDNGKCILPPDFGQWR